MDTKSPHYTLIIDENRNTMLAVVYALLMRDPLARSIYIAECSKQGVPYPEIESFIEEWSDKEHEMKWCTDPDCKYKKKSK